MTEEQKSEYPVVFDTCMVCGSKRLVAGDILEELRQKGTVPEGAIAALDKTIIPIGISPVAVQSGKVLVVLKDACRDCGILRVVRIEEMMAHIQMQAGSPGLPGKPPQKPIWGPPGQPPTIFPQ